MGALGAFARRGWGWLYDSGSYRILRAFLLYQSFAAKKVFSRVSYGFVTFDRVFGPRIGTVVAGSCVFLRHVV